jgi:sortase A
MSDRRAVDELSVEELEQLLYRKKRANRRDRLLRLKQEGRVVEVAGRPPPNPEPPPLLRATVSPGGALRHYTLVTEGEELAGDESAGERPRWRTIRWRWVFNQLLLAIEVAAVVGLVGLAFFVYRTNEELNREIAVAQEVETISLALPTATATPIIGVVLLPSGHMPPVPGQQPQQGEAGTIPDHLLPYINAYVAPPIPTPGPEQARRIEIAAIDVDKPVYQGIDWEQLKKGVGQVIGSAVPGQTGNLVLAAHNDIFGEIFRDLDELAPGDEIVVSTERQAYTYVVREIRIVEPTAVEVMEPTNFASITLISCYPYRVNTKRIVVLGDLVSEAVQGN